MPWDDINYHPCHVENFYKAPAGILYLLQVSENFSAKDECVNISAFVGHTVTTTTTQLGLCSMKAAVDYKLLNVHGWLPIKLYLKEQVAARFGPQAIVY